MSKKDEKRGSHTNRPAEQSAADDLQKQIDSLVRGEGPQDARSLRDLTRRPTPAPKINKKSSHKNSG